MNALAMLRRCGDRQGDAALDRLLRWDGARLTVEGEPHFAVHVWTPAALAAALVRLATGRDDATEMDLAAAERAVGILTGRDLRTPFRIAAATLQDYLRLRGEAIR